VETIAEGIDLFTTHVLPHAPFVGVFLILLVVGQYASTRLFTKQRAYAFYGRDQKGIWTWRWWYWGRETLPLQPITAGVLIGILWVDPEQAGWNRAASVGYFASAGALSLFGWAVLKGYAKKKGIVLTLPGESLPPEGGETYDNVHVEVGDTVSVRPVDPQTPQLDEASAVSSLEDVEDRDTARPPKRVP
jgi:hypothetical protein